MHKLHSIQTTQSHGQIQLNTIHQHKSQQEQTIQKYIATSPIAVFTEKQKKYQSKSNNQKSYRSSQDKKKSILSSNNRSTISKKRTSLNHRRNKTEMGKDVQANSRDPINTCLFVPFLYSKQFDFKTKFSDKYNMDLNLSKQSNEPKSQFKRLNQAQPFHINSKIQIKQKKQKEKQKEKGKYKQTQKYKQNYKQKQKQKYKQKLKQKQKQKCKQKQKRVSLPHINLKNDVSSQRYSQRSSLSISSLPKNPINISKESYQLQPFTKTKYNQSVQISKNVKQFKLKLRENKLNNNNKRNSHLQVEEWKQINYLKLKTCYYYIERKLAENQTLNQQFNDQKQVYSLKRKSINSNHHSNQQFNAQKYEKFIIIPKFPSTLQQASILIRNYKSIRTKKIQIDKLIRTPEFTVKFAQKQSLYFGQVQKDLFHGLGIYIQRDYLFQGEWKKGKKVSGIQSKTGISYEGQFIQDKRQGYGISYWNKGQDQYLGEWKNGHKHGNGVWKSLNGDQYIGQWTNGKVQGYGVHKSVEGQTYQGYFLNFLKHGKGKQLFPNGDSYQGSFFEGKPSGQGVYKFKKSKTIYQGQFNKGLRQGKGKLIVPNYLKYEGQFKLDTVEGYGRLYFINNDSYLGHFKNGLRHGKGTFNQFNENKIMSGLWKNGEFFFKQK